MSIVVAIVALIFAAMNGCGADTIVVIIMVGWLATVVEAIWKRIDMFVLSFIEAVDSHKDNE